jgi:hypothetical protein
MLHSIARKETKVQRHSPFIQKPYCYSTYHQVFVLTITVGQMRLADFSSYRTDEDVELAQFGALKTLLREALNSADNTRSAAADASAAAAAAKSIAADVCALCTAFYAIQQAGTGVDAKSAAKAMAEATFKLAEHKGSISPVQLSSTPPSMSVLSAKSKPEIILPTQLLELPSDDPAEIHDGAEAEALLIVRPNCKHEGPREPELTYLSDVAMLQQSGELDTSATLLSSGGLTQQCTSQKHLHTTPATQTRRKKFQQSLQQLKTDSIHQSGEEKVRSAPDARGVHAAPLPVEHTPSSGHNKKPGNSTGGSLRSPNYGGQLGGISQDGGGVGGGLSDLVSWLTGLARFEPGDASRDAPPSNTVA